MLKSFPCDSARRFQLLSFIYLFFRTQQLRHSGKSHKHMNVTRQLLTLLSIARAKSAQHKWSWL